PRLMRCRSVGPTKPSGRRERATCSTRREKREMEFRKLTQDEYDRKHREVSVCSEGHHANAQNVGAGRPTIGWGYTLNRDDNRAIWRRAGIELTPEQMAVLDRIDRAPRDRKTGIGLTLDKVLTEAESDRLLRASIHEYEAPAIAAGMP